MNRLLFGIICAFLITGAFAAQDHPVEKHIFDKITQLEFTEEGKAVLFTKDGDHLVHLLNENTFTIEDSFVPKGNGPGELQMVKAAFIDQENNHVYLTGIDNRILGYTLAGEPVFEKTFDELPVPGPNSKNLSLIIRDGYLFTSEMHRLNLSELSDDPIPMVKMFDIASTDLVYEFTLTPEQLAFPNVNDLSEARNVPIHPILTFINERLSVVTIDGLPYFYFFVNGEFVQRTEIDTDFRVEFATSRRDEFGNTVGVMTPANLNSLQLIHDNKLLISYGNIHQEIPVGYSVYEISHTQGRGLLDDISVRKTADVRIEEIEDISALNITYHDGDLFIHNRFDWLAFNVHVMRNMAIE